MIRDFWTETAVTSGCSKLMTVVDSDGNTVEFVVTPETYFVDHIMMKAGDPVIGVYDLNAPVPYIYPPQYRAIVMFRPTGPQSIKVDYFNSQLLSSDGTLKLNISPSTPIILENGQAFTGYPANHYLTVIYSITTASIPAQTPPEKIIVMCRLE